MPIDDAPEQEVIHTDAPAKASHTGKFVAIFVIFAALAVGEIYTSTRLNSLRSLFEDQHAQAQQENEKLANTISRMQDFNTRQLEVLKNDIDNASKRAGSATGELRRARGMVTELQQQQKEQAEMLKQEIAQKADQQQLGALTQDVTAQRSDLETTKKSVGTLTADLGMARSELGTLIARNHQDVEYLRRLGERDYFEFTLDRNRPKQVAGIGLALKKTNVKHHRFNLALQADDMEVEKKDRTANEPIFFYVSRSKKPYEVVVNSVQSNQVKGYLSTPKGATEVAARSEGAR